MSMEHDVTSTCTRIRAAQRGCQNLERELYALNEWLALLMSLKCGDVNVIWRSRITRIWSKWFVLKSASYCFSLDRLYLRVPCHESISSILFMITVLEPSSWTEFIGHHLIPSNYPGSASVPDHCYNSTIQNPAQHWEGLRCILWGVWGIRIMGLHSDYSLIVFFVMLVNAMTMDWSWSQR